MKTPWIDNVVANIQKLVHHDNPLQRDATFEVLNDQIFGFSVAKIKNILKREFDIKCILHSKGNYIESVSDSTKLSKHDMIIVSAFEHDIAAIEALVGRLQG